LIFEVAVCDQSPLESPDAGRNIDRDSLRPSSDGVLKKLVEKGRLCE